MADIAVWDKRYLNLAEFIANEWSKDPSTRVGAVIYRPDGSPVSIGYNGFPQKIADTPERLYSREQKLAITIHGEMNAYHFAREPITGYSLVTWPLPPCSQCASHFIQNGIARVVAPKLPERMVEKWGTSVALSLELFEEAGVQVLLL